MIRSRPSALTIIDGLLAVVALFAPAKASAVTCDSLTSPMYLAGSGKEIVGDIAKAMSVDGVHLVYKLEGSCLALDSVLNGTKIGSATDMAASYWDDTGTEQSCTLPATGVTVDVGLSDVFPSTCQSLPNGLPDDIGDFDGPIEGYAFVVPKKSSQKVISAQAAYFVFGFGDDSGVDPWTDEKSLFVRNEGSGTQQMMSVAIGVPADRWKGTDAGSSGAVVTGVAGATDFQAAMGILTVEVADASRAQVTELAYQDAAQTCGYFPDSTSTAHDKINIRDGHYPIWGPLHLLTKLDDKGYPLDDNVKDLVAYLTGTKAPPGGVDLISLLAQVGIIPGCAMRVSRQSELGPLSSFAAPEACSCYFDSVATGFTDCTACTTDNECPSSAPTCSYGYCETQ